MSRKFKLILVTLIILSLISGVLGIMVGATSIHPVKIVEVIASRLISGIDSSDPQAVIISEIRLPRVILGFLVGTSLAVSGATMQGVFRNPMADPYILGISSGGALGAAIAILGGLSVMGGNISIPIASFIGAIGAAFIVYSIGSSKGHISVATLLLSGIALSALLSAMTSYLMFFAGTSLRQIVFWIMGGLWFANWEQVRILTVPMIVAIAILVVLSKDLNVLVFGDERAYHLGINVEVLRRILLILASILAGLAVSASGIIGFVGLIIPHITRLLVGPDHRVLIISSALIGGIFLITADSVARVAIAPNELPVGIITAFCGAPFFIYLLKVRKKVII